MVTPSYCLALAEELRKQGLTLRNRRLAIGIFGAELWTNAMRQDIGESAWASTRWTSTNLSEVMAPGVANECIESKDGPVIWEDHFYP